MICSEQEAVVVRLLAIVVVQAFQIFQIIYVDQFLYTIISDDNICHLTFLMFYTSFYPSSFVSSSSLDDGVFSVAVCGIFLYANNMLSS